MPGLRSPHRTPAVSRGTFAIPRGTFAVPPARPRRIPRWLVIVILGSGLILLLNAFGTTYLTTYRLHREAAQLDTRLRALERENAVLRQEIRRLHDPEYIERLAREELGLVKPGEISVILVRPTPGPQPTR